MNIVVALAFLLLPRSLAYVAASQRRLLQAEQIDDSTASVLDSNSLLEAIEDTRVTLITLETDVTIGSEFEPYVGSPLQVERNVTITGKPGVNPLLDFSRHIGIAQLCSSCTLRLVNISIANATRQGLGVLSPFLGSSGSRIEQLNSYNVRRVCAPAAVERALFGKTPRSLLFPAIIKRPQAMTTTNATYLGHFWRDAFHAADVTVDVPVTLVTGQSFAGGFALRRVNVTNLCWGYVTDECIAATSLEYCITNQPLSIVSNSATAGTKNEQHPISQVAAIAAPVAIGGALCLAAAVFLLWRTTSCKRFLRRAQPSAGSAQPYQERHSNGGSSGRSRPDLKVDVLMPGDSAPRRDNAAYAAEHAWHNANEHSDSGPETHFAGAGSVPVTRAAAAPLTVGAAAWLTNDISAGMRHESPYRAAHTADDTHTPSLPQSNPKAASQASPAAAAPPTLTGTVAWEPSDSCSVAQQQGLHTMPSTDGRTAEAAQVPAIEWGPLIGAGSFGRVYRCRWGSMHVAVKVIQHHAAAQSVVENEVQLHMKLQHPNIVRAYHYVANMHRLTNPSACQPPTVDTSSATASTRSASMEALQSTSRDQPATVGSATTSNDKNLLHQQHQEQQQEQQQEQRPLVITIHPQKMQQLNTVDPPAAACTAAIRYSLLELNTPAALSCEVAHLPSSSTYEEALQQCMLTDTDGTSASQIMQVTSLSVPDCNIQETEVDASATVAADDTMQQQMSASTAAAPGLLGSRKVKVVAFSPVTDPGSALQRRNKNPTSPAGVAAATDDATASSNSSREGCSEPSTSGAPAAAAGLSTRAAAASGSSSSNQVDSAAAASWPLLDVGSGSDSSKLGGSGKNPTTAVGGGSSGGSLRLNRHAKVLEATGYDAADILETWLVQELCDCGTLASIAIKHWKRETENDIQMLQRLLLLQDVARGLQFLHANHIVHGDLNANNVLVSSNEEAINGLTAKLADLGLSRVIAQQRSHKTTHTFGLLTHMPPCLLREGRLTVNVDIYAFGIMMWELYTGEQAWGGMHYGQFVHQVVVEHARPVIPSDMPEDYACLMTHCWAEDPNHRPTAAAVLSCLDLMVQDRMDRVEATLQEA